jgi:hypothetical protein
MLQDSATITMIDYRETTRWSRTGTRIEVPAGTHMVEILYSEESAALIVLAGSGYVAVSRRTLEVVLEPNRLYRPHAADDCDREWFWIEDLGDFDPTTFRRHLTDSDRTKPVVAGYTPPEDCGELN